jgi:hypothetical protein
MALCEYNWPESEELQDVGLDGSVRHGEPPQPIFQVDPE